MNRTRILIGACVAAIVLTLGVTSPADAGGKCSPGQHGNPHPGFKPGVCDN